RNGDSLTAETLWCQNSRNMTRHKTLGVLFLVLSVSARLTATQQNEDQAAAQAAAVAAAAAEQARKAAEQKMLQEMIENSNASMRDFMKDTAAEVRQVSDRAK